jgi:hypothetical protein
MDKKELLKMRLDGMTYREIGLKAGISPQRVQQLLSPPAPIRSFVVAKYKGRCNRCGVLVGRSGHIHHEGDLNTENYNDIENLELLCIACHRGAHKIDWTSPMVRLKPSYRSGEAARLIGIAHSTLRKYVQGGHWKPTAILGGQYFWSLERINEIRQGLGLPLLEEAIETEP